MTRSIVVTPDETPSEVLAAAIVEMSQGVKRLRAGRLNERAIVLLVHASTSVAQRDIKAVLNALESLEVEYLKPRR
jgi:hypothetical protein